MDESLDDIISDMIEEHKDRILKHIIDCILVSLVSFVCGEVSVENDHKIKINEEKIVRDLRKHLKSGLEKKNG